MDLSNPVYNKGNKALYILIALLSVVFLGFEYNLGGDFEIYRAASIDIIKGVDIYTARYGGSGYLPYMGNPTLAFLQIPFGWVSPGVAGFIWKLFNLLLLLRVWKLFTFYFSEYEITEKQYFKWVLLSFVAVSFVLYRNYHLNQFTVFLLYSVLESLYQVRNKKYPVFGIILLALGIIAKLSPIVAIPYLVYRGYYKSAIGVVVMVIGFVFLPAVFIGWDQNIFLYQRYVESLSPMGETNVFDVSGATIHGIATLISTLTIEGIGNTFTLDIKRNILNLDPNVVKVIIAIAKVGLVLGSLYFLKLKTIFSEKENKLEQLWELSYILLITPLIFPQQRMYNFLLLLPAVVYIVFGFVTDKSKKPNKVLFIFLFGLLLLNLELILGNFRELYWHFKVLTYGALIVLGVLTWMKPSFISKNN